MKKITVERATLLVALGGLLVSLILSECNRQANIELEEKKLEATLFLQAIEVDNKKSTLENLKFLLKMGAISGDRESVINALSDSVYLDATSQLFTNSDTVGFADFQITNNRKDKALIEQNVRGAYIRISSIDTLTRFELSQYTDNYGRAEFYFPKAFERKFTKVTVTKNGYKTRSYEMQLPDYNHQKLQKIILLEQ